MKKKKNEIKFTRITKSERTVIAAATRANNDIFLLYKILHVFRRFRDISRLGA